MSLLFIEHSNVCHFIVGGSSELSLGTLLIVITRADDAATVPEFSRVPGMDAVPISHES